MRTASIVSPFSIENTSEDWIIWEQSQSLTELMSDSKADDRSVITDGQLVTASVQSENISYIPKIQRPQYNAIIDRFTRANKMTGNFSSWAT